MKKIILALATMTVALSLGACGGSSTSSSTTTAPPATSSTTTTSVLTKAQAASEFLAVTKPCNTLITSLKAFPSATPSTNAALDNTASRAATCIGTLDTKLLHMGLAGQTESDVESLVAADRVLATDLDKIRTLHMTTWSHDAAVQGVIENIVRTALGLPAPP